MSRTARARLHRPRQRVFVFDSEALSKAVQGDREMTALIKTAPRLDIPIVTSALTTLEAWDPREASRQSVWNWTLSRIRVVHTDDRVIAMARDMLKTAWPTWAQVRHRRDSGGRGRAGSRAGS